MYTIKALKCLQWCNHKYDFFGIYLIQIFKAFMIDIEWTFTHYKIHFLYYTCIVLSTYVYIDFMHIPYKQEKKWDIWFKLSQLLDFISLTVDLIMMIAVWKTIELICMKKMVDLWERIIFYYTCDMESWVFANVWKGYANIINYLWSIERCEVNLSAMMGRGSPIMQYFESVPLLWRFRIEKCKGVHFVYSIK